MSDKSAHVYYKGMVQGVGFRITAHMRAAALGLKGWVKNLDDGRVEVLCEGDERKIRTFLEDMSSVFKKYIDDIGIEWQDATGEYEGFDIRYD
ncbi:MAG: acylphosphatase [Candidatus Omnitrophota bacterium]